MLQDFRFLRQIAQDSSLVGCRVVSLDEEFLTFQSTITLLDSGDKNTVMFCSSGTKHTLTHGVQNQMT